MLLRLIPASKAAFRFASDTLVVLPLPSVSGMYCDVVTVVTVVTAAKVFVFFVAIKLNLIVILMFTSCYH